MNKELEDLKNAFVSHCRELKCKEDYIKVCKNKFDKIGADFEHKDQLETENAGLKARNEKLEKVWEIVKKYGLQHCDYAISFSNYESYKEEWRFDNAKKHLTKTEFNLLKKILEEKKKGDTKEE